MDRTVVRYYVRTMFVKVFAGVAAAVMALLPCVVAAQVPKEIGTYRAWRAYVYTDSKGNKVCFMDSEPADTHPANVRRGQIYTLVTHRPGDKVRNEVSIFVGYPFKDGSTVKVTIGDGSFTLFTDADSAWNYDARGDRSMVEAMVKGNTMVVEGESSRGTNTRDTYSLAGFTAARDAIDKACPAK
jgi:hypothetical protein